LARDESCIGALIIWAVVKAKIKFQLRLFQTARSAGTSIQ